MKSFKLRFVALTTALVMTAGITGFGASAEEETPDIYSVQSIVLNDVQKLTVYDIDDLPEEDTEEISRSLYASSDTLTDSPFLEACSKSQWGYGTLSSLSNGSKRQEFYNALYEAAVTFWHSTPDLTKTAIGSYSDYICMTVDYSEYGLSKLEASETFGVFRNDNPVFYFIGTQIYRSSKLLYISAAEDYKSGSLRSSHNSAIKKYVTDSESLVKSLQGYYKKADKLYRKVLNDIDYAYSSDGSTPDQSTDSHCIIGGIINGRGVCETFAKVFQLICSYNGLDVVFVRGQSRNNINVQGAHAWNMLKLNDGNYYYFDPTWDDKKTVFEYFGLGKNSGFESSHWIEWDKCTEQNYLYSLPSVPAQDYDPNKAHTHSYSSWVTVTAPSCTTPGKKQRTCVNCGVTESQTIAPTGRHTYVDTVIAPTCTAGGYTLHTCSVCNYSYKSDTTAANGHTFVNWKIVKPATCTETGVELSECENCTSTQTRLTSAKGHSYESKVIAPDCTEGGYTVHTCTECGDTYEDEYTEANGHNFVLIEQTADSEIWECSECGEIKSEHIEVKTELGDLNGDGSINMVDLGLLRQYLANWEVDIILSNTDLNGDDEINMLDLALLQQYLANWDVEFTHKTESSEENVSENENELPIVPVL